MRPLVRLVIDLKLFAQFALLLCGPCIFAAKSFSENVRARVAGFIAFKFWANSAFSAMKLQFSVLFRERFWIYFVIRLLFAYHKRYTPPSFHTIGGQACPERSRRKRPAPQGRTHG